ncbi:MAG: hypothetical protein H6701_13340 [Myxococcales bacterium]|nr:hypothetical protein [Myxococcales bacterium]
MKRRAGARGREIDRVCREEGHAPERCRQNVVAAVEACGARGVELHRQCVAAARRRGAEPERPAGDRPDRERPDADCPDERRPGGDRPDGGRPAGDRSNADRPDADAPAGDAHPSRSGLAPLVAPPYTAPHD